MTDLLFRKLRASAFGKRVLIGVLDTGAKTDHVAWSGRVIYNETFTGSIVSDPQRPSKHGTQVASVAAAQEFGDLGVYPARVGVHPHALLAFFRPYVDYDPATNTGGWGTGTWFADACKAVAPVGVDVLNVSLSWIVPTSPAAYEYAAERALVVTSAGNGGSANLASADCSDRLADRLLFAGSLARDDLDSRADFSTRPGSGLLHTPTRAVLIRDRYLMAPGEGIPVLDPFFDDLRVRSARGGTSFSAPIVTAAAALVLAQRPSLRKEDAANILLDTADPIGSPAVFGAGRLNITRALTEVTRRYSRPVWRWK